MNSAPRNPIDPEFLRVVGAFTSSDRSWNTLVRELLASSITTNASKTATAATNGETVAVSRRDHLCAALDDRLGFVDICQLDQTLPQRQIATIAEISGGKVLAAALA